MRDPGSLWVPLPENGRQGEHVKTQLIFHSTGTRASAAANAAYFARPDVVVESTFVVGLSREDPTVQLLDSAQTADANTSASARAIAVEVVGTGDDDFTPWQLAECIRLGRWAADHHPIARRVCPTHDGSGVGWHVMFGAPGPWTDVVGKVCPGDRRIAQLRRDVLPAIFTDERELDVDEPTLRRIIREEARVAVWDAIDPGKRLGDQPDNRMGLMLHDTHKTVRELYDTVFQIDHRSRDGRTVSILRGILPPHPGA
jgi:hypothetical protein